MCSNNQIEKPNIVLTQALQAPSHIAASMRERATVAVLLSTYNGERYLAEQLDSIIEQTHHNWLIVASDDGSQDNTISILESYQRQLGVERLRIVDGPRRGFAANFISLATNTAIEADYFAFCDQDDRWHPDKLERALCWLKLQSNARAALYCARTRLIDAAGQFQGFSPLFNKPPSFQNALVQSLAGGNTMVFNRNTRQLLIKAGNVPVVSHDWWAYILTSGSGGLTHYDPEPSIDYRQHGNNLIGANSDLADRLFRIKRMLTGDFLEWNNINLNALEPHKKVLTTTNSLVLQHFVKARRANLPTRLGTMLRSGVYRQTLLGNLGLIAATVLRKI